MAVKCSMGRHHRRHPCRAQSPFSSDSTKCWVFSPVLPFAAHVSALLPSGHSQVNSMMDHG